MRTTLACLLIGMVACSSDEAPDARISVRIPDAGPRVFDARPPDAAAPTPDAGPSAAQIERGRYLVNNVFACVDCHTPRNPDGSFIQDKLLSGVECFVDIAPPADNNLGCLHTRNLTPHATGLATRTDDQIKNMFLNGVRPNGQFLANVMPYWLLHNMTPADADAIVAYLRSIPPVDHMVPPSEPPLWNNIPAAAPPIQDSDIPPAGGTGATHDSAVRGRYFAGIICIDCHTPDSAQGSAIPIDLSKALQGNRGFQIGAPFPDIVYSRNLTPDATGIMGWSVADVVKAIREGIDKNGDGLCPPMPSAPPGAPAPFRGMTEADATDLANYLLNLEPKANTISGTCKSTPPGP